MKWVNHEIVTGVIAYTASADPLLAVCSMIGAIIPDRVEGNPRSSHLFWSWRSRHRGWSHWPLGYLLIALLVARMTPNLLHPADIGMPHIVFWLCVGALLHIAEDAVCGKVPLLTPWGKHGIRLFTVGSVTEYLSAISIVLVCYLIHTHFLVF